MKRRIERRLDTGGPSLKPVEFSVGDETQVSVYRNRKPADHAHVYSVTKSVTSILVGVAIDEGKLRLDQTLGEPLPDLRGEMSDETAGITLQQLLTMTAGFQSNEDDTFPLDDPDIVAQTVAFGPTTTAGESFACSNERAHVVAAVLAEAVGQTPLKYARAKLFDPHGIDSRRPTKARIRSPPRSSLRTSSGRRTVRA
jgi:CubicO group peptidase (beta-lactamase class C family)